MMHHSKCMMDYMDYISEMHQLFPKNEDHDRILTSPTSHRSFNHSTMAQSSSSNETSPTDSFPDMAKFPSEMYQPPFESKMRQEKPFEYHIRQENPNESHIRQEIPYESHIRLESHMREAELMFERQMRQENVYETHLRREQYLNDLVAKPEHQMLETPYIARRQRPIVGRRIMVPDQIPKIDESNIWMDEPTVPLTPPFELKCNQKVYELFPADKGLGYRTPVKTSPSFTTPPKMPNISPSMSNISPRMTAMSPRMTNMSPSSTKMSQSMTNISPGMATMPPRFNMSPGMTRVSPTMTEMSTCSTKSLYPPRFSTPAFKDPIIGPNTLYRQNYGATKMCTFCKKNGETSLVYMTHTVKEKIGNKNVVTCPILRSHVCSTCGATADNAHTITYCPVLRSTNNGQPLQSTTITLKNTRVKSNGRRRY